MLTKADFSEIRKIIREEVENEVNAAKEQLQADIIMARMRVQADIEELKDRIKNLEIQSKKNHKELKEEIKMVSHFLDKENIKALKRVERLEKKVGISPPPLF